MAVVNIRGMRVRMGNRRVLMGVLMRFLTVSLKIVRVLMVLVVPVSTVMVQNLVSVRMLMRLADMEPDSQSHEHSRNPE
jgi:hypothetical protein